MEYSNLVKFRAYDVAENTMHQDVLVASSGNFIALNYIDDKDGGLEIISAIYDNSEGTLKLMQFSGYCDGLKSEVFEWDVVRSNVTVNNHLGIYVVAKVAGAFRVANIRASFKDSDAEFNVKNLEWLIKEMGNAKDIAESFGTWQLLSSILEEEKLLIIGNVFNYRKNV